MITDIYLFDIEFLEKMGSPWHINNVYSKGLIFL
jgi:hypothetical protein